MAEKYSTLYSVVEVTHILFTHLRKQTLRGVTSHSLVIVSVIISNWKESMLDGLNNVTGN